MANTSTAFWHSDSQVFSCGTEEFVLTSSKTLGWPCLVTILTGATHQGAYYIFSPRYVPKASPFFRAQTTGDIAVMVLQNVGVVQVAWTSSGAGLETWRNYQSMMISLLFLDFDFAKAVLLQSR